MSDASASKIEVHEDEEWSAVYLDGKLVEVGDSYLADEWIRAHFGVKTVSDNAFMRGQTQREGVAQTLDEVADYAKVRQERLDRIAALRAEGAADFDAMRVAREWPTPNHMRKAADALDALTPARYGDVLRWFADRCDEWVWHLSDPSAAERLERVRAAALLASPVAPEEEPPDEFQWRDPGASPAAKETEQ